MFQKQGYFVCVELLEAMGLQFTWRLARWSLVDKEGPSSVTEVWSRKYSSSPSCYYSHNLSFPSSDTHISNCLPTYSLPSPFFPFCMSEEQQQSPKEYSFQVVTFQNTIPPMHHNQANMPLDSAVSSPSQVSLWSRILLTAGGRSRSRLHKRYHTTISSHLLRRPNQLAVNHTVSVIHNTMARLCL